MDGCVDAERHKRHHRGHAELHHTAVNQQWCVGHHKMQDPEVPDVKASMARAACLSSLLLCVKTTLEDPPAPAAQKKLPTAQQTGQKQQCLDKSSLQTIVSHQQVQQVHVVSDAECAIISTFTAAITPSYQPKFKTQPCCACCTHRQLQPDGNLTQSLSSPLQYRYGWSETALSCH